MPDDLFYIIHSTNSNWLTIGKASLVEIDKKIVLPLELLIFYYEQLSSTVSKHPYQEVWVEMQCQFACHQEVCDDVEFFRVIQSLQKCWTCSEIAWKNKLALALKKIIREINYLPLSKQNSRNFCQKSVKLNFRNFPMYVLTLLQIVMAG